MQLLHFIVNLYIQKSCMPWLQQEGTALHCLVKILMTLQLNCVRLTVVPRSTNEARETAKNNNRSIHLFKVFIKSLLAKLWWMQLYRSSNLNLLLLQQKRKWLRSFVTCNPNTHTFCTEARYMPIHSSMHAQHDYGKCMASRRCGG